MEYTHIISAVPEGEHFDSSAINEGVWLSVGHLDSIESRLAGHTEEVNALNSGIAAHETAIEGLNATIAANEAVVSERDARIVELEGEVAKLKAAPAASLTGTSIDKDDVGPESVIGSDPVNAEAARLRAMRNSK